MNVLDVVIGIARGRIEGARRALRPPGRSTVRAAPPTDRRREVATVVGPEDVTERAVEDGYDAAWLRRKARDEAEDPGRIGAGRPE